MTTRFRLDAVAITTTDGDVRYEFPSALTVLAGDVGVGKSTLLELIKFGFGGKGLLTPVVEQYVHDIAIDITIGAARYRIARNVNKSKNASARVTDLITGERLKDHHIDDKKDPQLSDLLLTTLGLPTDMRAAARGAGSINAGNRITFADIFTYLYVSQADINRDIAHSEESYREPKRKAVFELLFGITDAQVLSLRSRQAILNGEVIRAENEHRIVLAFLRESRTTSREEAEIAVLEAVASEERAEADTENLRQAIDPVSDRLTQALRDQLTDAERSLAEARAAVTALIGQQADYRSERRRVQQDLDRLNRMRDAGERLANIEFSVCPRCMQSLSSRQVPPHACRLCLQPDPVSSQTDSDVYEQTQLQDQLTEMDDQLLALADQVQLTSAAVASREERISSLTTDIDVRTRERITPRLQAFSDATTRLAEARARQRQLEIVLHQWDRADDLGRHARELRVERQGIAARIAESEAALATRRQEILDDVGAEFEQMVRTLGVPGVETASIHPTNYLPLLNSTPFASFSQAGGIKTASQVAYWLSLLTVALRRGDTFYPAFMILDSPRLALPEESSLSAALYRRMVTVVDAARERLQLVVADNELPTLYRKQYDQIDFTYARPTISTIHHPGRIAVRTISETLAETD